MKNSLVSIKLKTISAGLVTSGMLAAISASAETADFVFTNGAVYTIDSHSAWANSKALEWASVV